MVKTVTTAGSFDHEYDPDAFDHLIEYVSSLPMKTDRLAATMMIEAAVDQIFSIRSLGPATRRNPIPFICVDKNLTTDSVIKTTYKTLIDLEIPAKTGMSIDALLDLPSSEFSLVIELCKEKEKRTADAMAKVQGTK